MLCLAQAPSDEPTLAWLVDRVNFDELEKTLRENRLLGLLGRRLIAAAGTEVPAEFAEAVERIVADGRSRAALQQMTTWGILGALDSRGVPAMPLKGAFLGEWLHGDAGLRLSNDIDILVSPDQMLDAIDVFEQLGYARPPKSDQLPPRLHHVMRSPAGLPTIELHWRLHWYEKRFARDMLSRSYVVEGALRRPAPRDELISLLLFYARDGFVGLRMPVDIAAWWLANGDRVSRSSMAEALDFYPELARAVWAASLAVSRLLDLSLAERLPGGAPDEWRTRTALRFADLVPAGPGRAQDQAALIDGLLAPAAGVPAFVERQFWPVLPGNPSLRERLLHAGALAVRSSALLWNVRRPRASGALQRGPVS
jgi:Uncharacterised nucleotidyltransferase